MSDHKKRQIIPLLAEFQQLSEPCRLVTDLVSKPHWPANFTLTPIQPDKDGYVSVEIINVKPAGRTLVITFVPYGTDMNDELNHRVIVLTKRTLPRRGRVWCLIGHYFLAQA